MKPKSFTQLFEEAKKRDAYWVADAIYTFTEDLHQMAEKKGLSRSDLARLLGTSPAYITKIFRGDVNFTIESMVRLSRAVGARLHTHLAPEGYQVVCLDIPSSAGFEKKHIHPDSFEDEDDNANAIAA